MVFEKVKAILSEQFDVEEDSITAETTLADDLGADSLDLVELIMSVEEADVHRRRVRGGNPRRGSGEHQDRWRFGGVHRRPHQRVSHTVNLNFGKKRARAAARALFLPAARKALPFPKRKGARFLSPWEKRAASLYSKKEDSRFFTAGRLFFLAKSEACLYNGQRIEICPKGLVFLWHSKKRWWRTSPPWRKTSPSGTPMW